MSTSVISLATTVSVQLDASGRSVAGIEAEGRRRGRREIRQRDGGRTARQREGARGRR